MSDTESEKDYYEEHTQIYDDFDSNNCVKATYSFDLEFRTPFNLHNVDEYYVKWGNLNVRIGDEWLEFRPYIEPREFEWKWADNTEIVDISDTNLDCDDALKKYIEDTGHLVWECSTSRWSQKKKPEKKKEDIRELTIDEAEEKMNKQQEEIKRLEEQLRLEKENSSYWKDRCDLKPPSAWLTKEERETLAH